MNFENCTETKSAFTPVQRQIGSVLIQTCPNPNARNYHLRECLSEGTDSDCPAAHLIRRNVRGLQSVYPNGYEVTIIKAALFSWEEIEAQLLPLLESFKLPDQEAL